MTFWISIFASLALSAPVWAQDVTDPPSPAPVADATGDRLALGGAIESWPLGSATVRSRAWSAPVTSDGTFELPLGPPNPPQLDPVRLYDGEDCLVSSNPDSRYLAIFYLEVVPLRGSTARLHLRTPRFSEMPGERMTEFHYYTEPTTVTGRCEIVYDDGWTAVYEFPEIAVRAGWNVLHAQVAERGADGVTYRLTSRLGAEADPAARWEADPPTLAPGQRYVGIGVEVDPHADGLEIAAVHPGGAAERAGLRRGDVLLGIDGRSTAGMSTGAAVLHLRGNGTVALLQSYGSREVALEVRRGEEAFAVDVPRAPVTVPRQ